MKLDELPIELLLKIFSFLPRYDQVSLVNKLFYGVACKVNDTDICLRIDNRMDSKRHQSLLASKRSITKVEIAFHHPLIERQISVVQNFSETIKHLKYFSARPSREATLLKMLSLTPNLEHLYVRQPPTTNHSFSFVNEELNVKKLKSLEIVGNDHFGELIDRLPVGVLKELRMSYFDWQLLGFVFKRQLNITNLKLHYVRCDDVGTDIFDQIKLDSLDLQVYEGSTVAIGKILTKQRQLKSLALTKVQAQVGNENGPVDDSVMNAVTVLLELDMLTLDISEPLHTSFVKIRKLKNLKHLVLRFDMDGNSALANFKILAQSDNTSITSLTILGRLPKVPDYLIGALARSAPCLRHLKFIPDSSATDVNEVMTHFNFVEVLECQIVHPILANHSDIFNPKLREMTLISDGRSYEQWLTKWIAAYPNVKKLKVIFRHDISLQLRPILDGFTKLESLTMRTDRLMSVTRLTVEDLDCLQHQNKNLKFVKLGFLDRDNITEKLARKLRKKFELVQYYRGSLSMATDRYTMNRECKLNFANAIGNEANETLYLASWADRPILCFFLTALAALVPLALTYPLES